MNVNELSLLRRCEMAAQYIFLNKNLTIYDIFFKKNIDTDYFYFK